MPQDSRKPRRSARRVGAFLGVLFAGIAGCAEMHADVGPLPASVFEAQPPEALTDIRTITVADSDALRRACRPLGKRIGLLQARSTAEWRALVAAIPELAAASFPSDGAIVGVATWTGRPLSGDPPVTLTTIQRYRDMALLRGSHRGGTFFPDGTAYITLGQIRERCTVTIVSLDGLLFTPQTSSMTSPQSAVCGDTLLP